MTSEPCGVGGEITTNPLTSHLIDHGEKGPDGEEPPQGEAWVELTNTPPSEYLAEFVCEPEIPLKLSGSVRGKIGPDNVQTKAGKQGKKPKPTFTEEFSAGVGEHDLTVTVTNPLTEQVESGPAVQEGTECVFYTEKKLEITADPAPAPLMADPGAALVPADAGACGAVKQSIRSGVKIEANFINGKGESKTVACTAGPQVIPTANKSQTYLLTAGHCVDLETTETPTTKPTEAIWTAGGKVIGPGVKYVDETTGDYGDILIAATGEEFKEPVKGKEQNKEVKVKGEWQTNNPKDPVEAVTASGVKVTGEQKPEVGTRENPHNNCHRGWVTGKTCSTVEALNWDLNETSTGLVAECTGKVVSAPCPLGTRGGSSVGGDSGGPFFPENNEKLVEGIDKGRGQEIQCATKVGGDYMTETACWEYTRNVGEGGFERKYAATNGVQVLFQPLKKYPGTAPQGALEGLGVELLTATNENNR